MYVLCPIVVPFSSAYSAAVHHGADSEFTRPAEKIEMLWTIAVLLLILWLLGMVSSYTLGGFIHILLILAVVAILIRIIQGRSPV
jgi:asparagine N-glycosylation enzyme membrane subunit Stt3